MDNMENEESNPAAVAAGADELPMKRPIEDSAASTAGVASPTKMEKSEEGSGAAGAGAEAAAAGGEAAQGAGDGSDALGEELQIVVAFKKDKYTLTVREQELIGSVKAKLEPLSGVPVENQKLMYKCMLSDTNTVAASALKAGTKVMLIGTSKMDIQKEQLNQIVASVRPAGGSKPASATEVVQSATDHKKIIEKGVPEGAVPGIPGQKSMLAEQGNVVKNIYDKRGDLVRLTFKLEDQQIWIGSKTRTDKLNMAQIRNVSYEILGNHPGYAMLVLHAGATEKSNLYYFYVPVQYCDDIKRLILS